MTRFQRIYLLLVTASSFAIGILFWLTIDQSDTLNRQIQANTATANEAAIAAYQADRALCLRLSTTKAAIRAARQFLRDHPHGTQDFPRVFIVRGIGADLNTIRALADIHCPPAKPKGLTP